MQITMTQTEVMSVLERHIKEIISLKPNTVLSVSLVTQRGQETQAIISIETKDSSPNESVAEPTPRNTTVCVEEPMEEGASVEKPTRSIFANLSKPKND